MRLQVFEIEADTVGSRNWGASYMVILGRSLARASDGANELTFVVDPTEWHVGDTIEVEFKKVEK